jgi:hypothetical protein
VEVVSHNGRDTHDVDSTMWDVAGDDMFSLSLSRTSGISSTGTFRNRIPDAKKLLTAFIAVATFIEVL